MDITAIDSAPTLRGPSTLLRLQGDERLVTLTRRGNQAAYEVLVQRYQARLLAFCRHMLGSKEDAEDVLQEVFANAFNAINGDDRTINVRPWLYRIARNRCLNHLRKVQPIGVDTLDDRMADNGISAEDTAHRRQEFRDLLGDVRALAETQRTALLLREIDALSYEQIAEAMDTTVPSVKSLLVRARVGLAEASEARNLTCEEVREELGEAAESLKRLSPPIRRHVKDCERCASFQTYLKANNRTLTAIMPIGPLVIAKKLLAHLTAGMGASGGAAAGAVAATSVTGGMLTTGVTAVASKTAAGLAAAAIVTAGAVEVDSARTRYSASDGLAQPAIRASAPVQPPAVRVTPAAPAAPVAAPPVRSERSGGLTTTATTEKSETTTTTTRATTTTAPEKPTTATTPAPPVVAAAPAPPTTTAAAPPATPPTPTVDTKEQNVTLPSTTTTAPPTTTTKPPTKTTPPPPTTTPTAPAPPTTTPTDVPPPTPTPGATGELPATPLVPGP
ncbi:MAG: sigma-70 family RNA polymerase sigma factor [Patulibacter sp.]|nr:sigma-70 family RNA polymerase sigma factor [Patulibacter sp.]